ncbi:MAG TPA: DUF1800 domain-containing protein [Candidatus Binataceae bacterium]
MERYGDIPNEDRALHALNRLAFGPRPGDLETVRAMGVERYVDLQLHPESIAIPESLVDQIRSYRTLSMSAPALFAEFQRPIMETRRENKGGDKAEGKDAIKEALERQRIVMLEAVEARIVRAIEGTRQLQEVMTNFWFNHFNIFAAKGLDNIWTGSFEQLAIRPHTMGKFRTLLGATAKHPAMLFYLDNWQNTAPGSTGTRKNFEGINENYARELMELHTLGVSGGYSQNDVIALAHILTGWGLPKPAGGGAGGGGGKKNLRGLFGGGGGRRGPWGLAGAPVQSTSGFYFDPQRHDFSSKTLLGHTIEGSGVEEGEQALDLLARSPATANHLSFQLAQYFVADVPPKPLVSRMTARYLETDGDIRAVLQTMFTAPEFWDRRYYRAKFKTPYEYVISCARATSVPITNYRPLYGTMALLGMPLYGCLTPNGYANTEDSWLNPDAMMTRLSFVTALGNGNLPLDRPPFEENSSAGVRVPPRVVNKRGAAAGVKFDADPDKPKAHQMTPLDPGAVAATLGGRFSSSTANALEAAEPRLRAALMLGSPEFMRR